MGFWQILALVYSAAFIVILCMGAVKPIRITVWGYALAALLALSLASLAYILQPGANLDLYRLQQNVDQMRTAAVGPLERLNVVNEQHKGLLAFRLLCWVVSFLPDNGYMSAVAVFVTFSLLLFVLVDFLRREEYGSNALLPGVLLIFMGMPAQHVFSGMRNAMAVAMAVAGLYCVCYRRKHFLLSALLFVLSVTMHPVTIVILPVALIAGRRRQMAWRAAALAALPIVFALANLLSYLPLGGLRPVVERILYYQTRSYPYDRPEMLANFLVFIAVGGGYALLRRVNSLPEETAGERVYLNAYYLMGIAMLGCVTHRDFTLRLGYMMGIGAVPLLCKIFFRRQPGENETIVKIVPVGVALVLAVCCLKVYYDTFVVMGQWQFG